MGNQSVRVGVDVGGTFTDFALEKSGKIHTTKILTTPDAPERAILSGLDILLNSVGISPQEIDVLIHGTTLVTNAIIQRKGACTAMITTEGFRDVIEFGKENRFDQYDLNIDKPEPLVPRYLRFGIPERLSAKGDVLLPLDVAAVERVAEQLQDQNIESVAICFLHSFIDPHHEQLACQTLKRLLPHLQISLSSEVAPEIREYERFSTTVANAYVQPKISDYLQRLKSELGQRGFGCPVYLFLSSGGLTELETACQFPIRLVESGPAGGAILACHLAKECEIDRLLSFDMGGTTAKICVIDDARPQMSRTFEVGRVYRFKAGSGLPVIIPVIDMVEIGAGGGSIVHVDNLQRIKVGPESAASNPGPACYDLGGTKATVTDANVVLGRIATEGFAGGSMVLSHANAEQSLHHHVGAKLGLTSPMAAYGVSEIVEEDMANAAREHATESGKSLDERTMIAFGGGAPVHAVRLAQKLGIDRIMIPKNAGVGSAVGFLRAPMSYEISRSARFVMSQFDADVFNTTFDDISSDAHHVLKRGTGDQHRHEERLAFMRYVGQGYEVAVQMPLGPVANSDAEKIIALFDQAYRKLYERSLENLDIEIVGLSVAVSTQLSESPVGSTVEKPVAPQPSPAQHREVFTPETGEFTLIPVYHRAQLKPGMVVESPAIISEDHTTTIIPDGFRVTVDSYENLIVEKRSLSAGSKKMAAKKVLKDIRFQVVWNRLLALVEEQAKTLMKTAFSPVVRESGDLSAGLFNPQGKMLVQAITGTPGHVNSMAAAVPHFLTEFPLEHLAEGDHLITNDPWITSGHLHDITVLSPVFYKGQVIAFFCCTCHQLDIGGLGQGPDGKSVFEEGLYIPVMKLVKAGVPNQDLLKIIRSNVRTPYEVQGDILSYVSSNETSGQRLRKMMQEFNLETLDDIGQRILDRSRAAMIDEIRKLPNGTTRNKISLDAGIKIECAVTIKDNEIEIDYTGSSAASSKGINLVLNYTKAYSNFGIRCLVGPQVPNNSGSLSPIHIRAPEGSILNVQHPWPVCARHIIGQFLPDAVMGCIAQIIPQQVPAEGASCLWGMQIRGGPEINAEAGYPQEDPVEPYEILFFNSGGMGARPGKDGLSVTGFPSGVKAMSIEIVENMGPIVVWRKEMRPNSAGNGEWRGGMGQIVEVGTTDGAPFSLFAMFDRTTYAARGRQGGENGKLGALRIKDGHQLDSKGRQLIGAGERVEMLSPGGAGYGDPEKRDSRLIENDRQNGLIN